jgi:O-antigen ligase
MTRRRHNLGFAVLTVVLIITSCFAYNKTEAFIGLFNFVPYFLVFAAYSTLFQTITQLRQLSWIMVAMSVPVTMIGLGQLFLGWYSPKQWESVLSVFGWVLAPGGNPLGRMSSVFMYANTLAGYLLIVFILGFGLWLESYKQLRVKEKTTGISPVFPFLFLTLAVVSDFAALILTDSRNAWAIAIFACLVYAIYRGWRILVAGVAVVVAAVLLAAFAPLAIAQFFRKIVPAFFWARLNDQLYPHRAVGSLRATQWEFAWSLTLQRPLTGWGLRNFTQLYLARTHEWLGHPHNLFLMLSCETGVVATVLFCSLIGWIFIAGVQVFQKLNADTEDKLILFSYLLIVISLILFNTVDVSLYDVRLNSLSWIVVSAIAGVSYSYNRRESLIKK